MTTPTPEERRDLLRDLTREAVDAGTYGEPAPGMATPTFRARLRDALETEPHLSVDDVVTTVMRLLTEGHDDLRERLREVLRDTCRVHLTGPCPACERRLARLLPVVETALAEQRERAETAEHLLEHWADEHVILRAMDGTEVHADWCYRCRLERAEKAEARVQRVRRMAQVWIDIQPTHQTLTNEAHALAYAGEQIIAALDQPEET